MDQARCMPEGRAYGTAIRARVALAILLCLPLLMLGLLSLAAWMACCEAGKAPTQLLERVSGSEWAALAVGLLGFQLAYGVLWWCNCRSALQWRGAELGISEQGLSLIRATEQWRASWDDIREVMVVPRALRIEMHAGGELRVPWGALEKGEFRGSSETSPGFLWPHLLWLVRAYLEAARRGLHRALEEPPVVVLQGRAARAVVSLAVAASLVSALVVTFVLVGVEVPHSAAVALAVIGTPLFGGGAYFAWVMRERGVAIGPDGIRYRAVRGTRQLTWGQIASVDQVGHLGLRVHSTKGAVELVMRRIAEVNLAALARSEGLTPNQVGLAVCEHYLAQTQ
jgi:hypothetical protein